MLFFNTWKQEKKQRKKKEKKTQNRDRGTEGDMRDRQAGRQRQEEWRQNSLQREKHGFINILLSIYHPLHSCC